MPHQLYNYRKGDYWHRELSVDNASALWLGVTNVAVQRNGANPDKVTNIVGNIFVPPATETITHDADGNTTADGRWEMTWDAENRLIKAESLSSAPVGSKRRVEYAYDYQGRLLRRTVTDINSTPVEIEDLKYIYDGWRCMAEINVTGGDTVRSYVWGLDISGTMDGAGGVGGLLGVFLHSNSAFHFPFYDGNGNVVGLVNGNNGNVSANYEYDAFGKVIRQTGGLATLNRFRFSTKYTDDETDLVYYGYRFYNPSTGRWLSRDPIEELGFELQLSTAEVFKRYPYNEYLFLQNDGISLSDFMGLAANWHHLLPKAFEADFLKAGITDIHAAKYGVVLDVNFHTGKNGIHPEWNNEWKKFFDNNKGKKITPAMIHGQLNKMQKSTQFSFHLAKGAAAKVPYHTWLSDLRKARQAAVKAAVKKGTKKIIKKVPLLGILFIVEDVKAKGVVGGIANNLLDQVPYLGWVKMSECATGDWIPNK